MINGMYREDFSGKFVKVLHPAGYVKIAGKREWCWYVITWSDSSPSIAQWQIQTLQPISLGIIPDRALYPLENLKDEELSRWIYFSLGLDSANLSKHLH